VIFIFCVSVLWICSCGLPGEAKGPRNFERRSEVVLEPEEGLDGAVQVDSLSWRPVFLEFENELADQELEGIFAVVFTNLTDLELQLRYDLRFYDRDGFLIDAFIPFGQPVELAAHQVRKIEGRFFLRADDPREFQWLAIMRLVARIMYRTNRD
jgi:hypothetical protein